MHAPHAEITHHENGKGKKSTPAPCSEAPALCITILGNQLTASAGPCPTARAQHHTHDAANASHACCHDAIDDVQTESKAWDC